MGRTINWLLCALAASMAACSANTGDPAPQGMHPDDVKPADASELERSNIGIARAPHTQHYVDGTNLWLETQYPMGTDNPNCKDWWVYDRWLSLAPPIGMSEYSTYDTWHPWATGSTIDSWLATIPPSLGYNTSALTDHNAVVARGSGRCSGRYVFQWDNHDTWGHNNFMASSYFVGAYVPTELIPSATSTACDARSVVDIPHAWVDLYVCEAPIGTDIYSFGSWCGANSGNWRKVENSLYGYGTGYYNSYWHRCDVTAAAFYEPPYGSAAVSFNMVIKTGVGHGVAPARIWVYRYN